MQWWRSGLVVVLVAAVATLPACADPDDHRYTALEAGKLTVDRPAAWNQQIPVDSPWTVGFKPAPDALEQMQVSGDFGDQVTAAQAVAELIGQAQVGLRDFTVVQTRDIEVDGATTAQAVRYTITDNQGSQLSGEWVVAAHWPNPQTVAVSLLTPGFDPDLERRVIDSMRFVPTA